MSGVGNTEHVEGWSGAQVKGQGCTKGIGAEAQRCEDRCCGRGAEGSPLVSWLLAQRLEVCEGTGSEGPLMAAEKCDLFKGLGQGVTPGDSRLEARRGVERGRFSGEPGSPGAGLHCLTPLERLRAGG